MPLFNFRRRGGASQVQEVHPALAPSVVHRAAAPAQKDMSFNWAEAQGHLNTLHKSDQEKVRSRMASDPVAQRALDEHEMTQRKHLSGLHNRRMASLDGAIAAHARGDFSGAANHLASLHQGVHPGGRDEYHRRDAVYGLQGVHQDYLTKFIAKDK